MAEDARFVVSFICCSRAERPAWKTTHSEVIILTGPSLPSINRIACSFSYYDIVVSCMVTLITQIMFVVMSRDNFHSISL